MINNVILTGRLVRDPVLKETKEGTFYSNFTLAVDRNYKNQEGEKDTDFIDIVIWRNQAKRCVEYLNKGRLIGVEGSLRISKNKKDGRTYTNTSVQANRIEFLDSPN